MVNVLSTYANFVLPIIVFFLTDVYVQQVVNSEVTVKMEKLSVTLNKEEYELAKASVCKLNAHAIMRDENLQLKGKTFLLYLTRLFIFLFG